MKRAPQVWGELDTTGRDFFHSYVEKSWPLFRCAEGGWKLEKLARTSYPAWRVTHIDVHGNWLAKEDRKKRKLKTEPEDGLASLQKKQKLTGTLSDFPL